MARLGTCDGCGLDGAVIFHKTIDYCLDCYLISCGFQLSCDYDPEDDGVFNPGDNFCARSYELRIKTLDRYGLSQALRFKEGD